MEAKEHLFYGLGIIAFAVARADGKIQNYEQQELQHIIAEWAQTLDADFNISEIIFSVLKNSKPTLNEGFDMGMKYMRLGSDHITEGLKEKFIFLIEDIAHAFPPVTLEEGHIIERFSKEMESL